MLKLVLSVVAVVILAGGGYFFFAPNAKDLNLMQYVPESIAAYLPAGTETEVVDLSSEPFLQENSVDQTEETVSQVTEMDSDPEIIEVQPIINENIADAADPLVDKRVETNAQSAKEIITKAPIKVAEPIVQQKQQEEILTKKPPEVIKLENKLVDMNSSISELDNENEKLQQKFKEMLKKNKDLALTLSQIEEKLKAPK